MNNKPWLKHYDPGVPAMIDYPANPLHYFLEDAARKYPDHICTVFEKCKISYSQMQGLTNDLATALIDLGLQKGERVAVCLPNIPQFVLVFYAVLKAGGVVVAMNPQYKQPEMEFQLNDCGARILIGLSQFYPLYKNIEKHTKLEIIIITTVEDTLYLEYPDSIDEIENGSESLPYCNPGEGDYWLISLVGRHTHDVLPIVHVDAEDAALFQYSGGTTGVPKGAVALHRNVVANTLQFKYWLAGLKDGNELVLAAIPLYHVYGMVIAMSVGISLGATLIPIPDARDIDHILSSIETFRATFFPGVPAMYQAIIQHQGVLSGKYDLRSIKVCISGSAPLLPETKARFELLTGSKLVEGYGLSEAPTATHCNPVQGENRAGSIGLPLPDVNCRIVDLEDGMTNLEPGGIGELVIQGPQVMKGYHNLPEETKRTLQDGWLYTGDVASMDNDGYFYLVDRKKELIKVSGFQVWPGEVEQVIARHPAVLEVGVAGVSDPVHGEAVKAWVVLKPGEITTDTDIRQWCEVYLVSYKIPREVEFRERLPRTAVGKILRRELSRQHTQTS